jgi:TPR repeat protein
VSYLRIITSHWEEVQAGRWRLSLAVASPNPAVTQLGTLTEIARASPSEAAFRGEVARPRRTNRGVRSRLTHVDALVAAAVKLGGIELDEVRAGELTWRLLFSLWPRELRLEGADQTDRTNAVSSLRAVTPDGTPGAADQLFSRLAELASRYAPEAAEVTEIKLRRDLSGMPLRMPASRPSSAPGPWSPPRPVLEWDALQLGVHRAISLSSAVGPAGPELTTYVPRAHDTELRKLLQAPTQPVMVMLVGGSSTGKSRAAYEAVRDCLPDWSLFRPVDATELMSLLASGPLGPRVLLWLNEAQIFLRGQPEAAAALRRFLTGPGPVAVVGTIWPQYWKELITEPAAGDQDLLYQARELLLHNMFRVDVAEAFTGDDLAELRKRLGTDPRLEAAAEAARSDGKVIQALAGGPALVRRYERPADLRGRYGRAVVTTAMDSRRLGHESPIGRALLDDVAAIYLDPADRVDSPADWLGAGLADATEKVHGIAALTGRRDQPGVGPADGWVLHDYLDQYARTARRGLLIPAEVWDALIVHTASAADRIRLAVAADARSLYHNVVRFATPAARAGEKTAMLLLAATFDRSGNSAETERWLRQAADAGDVVGTRELVAFLVRTDRVADAERWLRQATAEGNTEATLEMADLLSQISPKAEIEWLREQADGGNLEAVWRLTELLRPEEYGSWLSRAAEDGDTWAMRELAELTPADAERWLHRAAEVGDVTAIRALADLLDHSGRCDEAGQWLRRAAQSGDTAAMWQLGEHLAHLGRAADALEWLQRVNVYEPEEVQEMAELLESVGGPAVAEQWLRRGSQDDTISPLALAEWLQLHDRGVEAKQLLMEETEAGNPFAWMALAQILQQSGQDAEAEQILRRRAGEGDSYMMQELANALHHAGRSAEAEQWRLRSAEAGNVSAMQDLAQESEHQGDVAQAEQWLRRAVESGARDGLNLLAQLLQRTGRPAEAQQLLCFGIEPGGATANPW